MAAQPFDANQANYLALQLERTGVAHGGHAANDMYAVSVGDLFLSWS